MERPHDRSRIVEALLFLAPEPVSVDDLADAAAASTRRRSLEALRELRDGARRPRRRAARDRRRLDARLAPGRRGGRAAAARPPAHAGAHARPRPRRWRSSPTCSRSRGRRWRASAAWRRSRRPRALRRARADRGGRPLAVRRRALPHDAAVPEAVRPATRSTSCPSSRSGTRARRTRRRCATACCARARRARRDRGVPGCQRSVEAGVALAQSVLRSRVRVAGATVTPNRTCGTQPSSAPSARRCGTCRTRSTAPAARRAAVHPPAVSPPTSYAEHLPRACDASTTRLRRRSRRSAPVEPR